MKNRSTVRLSRLAIGLAAALAAAPAFAQSTSASLGGRILGSDGAPVAGAQVTVLHTQSGTVSRATTDGEGRYVARGLRVGGPYTVTVSRDGYQSTAQEDVYALLAETSQVNLQMGVEATSLEAVTVVGTAGYDLFSADKMGAGTNVTREQIEAFPSIGRNIQDYARLDPRISQTDKQRGEISVGGQNTRFNAIKIDGVSTNDPFGLEANNLPTLRQPVSIDAIEEVQISVADYDVTITGATGGVINAVTKSGTNEFRGSAYYVFRDNDWVRNNANGAPFNGFQDEETYGGTFGGPLVKDTLFFFVNYEKFTRSAPGPSFGPTGSGASNIVNISPAQIAEIQQVARDVWGFNAGTLDVPGSLKTNVEEYAAKVDWNISDEHRASYRYSKTEQVDAVLPGFGNTSLSLNTYWYDQVKTFESHVAQLYSNWTDDLSTEFKISYREYSSIAQPFSRLPSIRVNVAGTTGVNLGTEQFRHVNVLETEEVSFYGAANYYMGDHELKFGFDYTTNDIYNLFGRDLNGVYTFNSIAAFRTGTPSFYTSRVASDGNLDTIAANLTQDNAGFFLQDTWSYNYNLTLMYGLRVDVPVVDDKPIFNPTIQRVYGLDNTQTIDGNELIQPRFGFNYTFDSERMTQLRGGVGLFQGSAANVWLANPFANTGLNFIVRESTTGAGIVFSPNPDAQPAPSSLPPRQTVDIVDDSLGQPSVWKANLAFDHELPWFGLIGSAEAIITNTKESLYYQKLDIGAPTRAGQDGRMLYWNAAGYNRNNFSATGVSSGGASGRANRDAPFVAAGTSVRVADVTYARPTNKGESQQLTLALSKPLVDNWFWQVSYTYTNATEVNPLTSSQATSNWNNNAIFQVNEEVASRTNYTIRDRFTAAVSYREFFFSDLKSEVSMFYEGRKGKPYSWAFFNDANGDGRSGNDLFYVPAAPGDVIFGTAAEEQAFFAFLANNPTLARFAGQVVDRNSEFNPWVNQVDLRLSQELPGFYGDNKAEIILDILNVGNLINKDWGHIDEIGFPSTRRIAYYGGIDTATGKYVYRFPGTVDNPSRRDVTGESRWAAQVTFRYRF
jgi:outer membrane receptor for ferrienterochelin and colicin